MLDAIEISQDHWTEAGAAFRRRIDDDIRKRSPGGVLPWERPVVVGQVDYWRVHAWALDRIDELVHVVLPDGGFIDSDTAWRGRRNERGNWITVALLTGAWFDPVASKRGSDLPGLISHIYRMSRRRAAIRLAAQLGVEAVRHG